MGIIKNLYIEIEEMRNKFKEILKVKELTPEQEIYLLESIRIDVNEMLDVKVEKLKLYLTDEEIKGIKTKRNM